jgi:hypothetical protein
MELGLFEEAMANLNSAISRDSNGAMPLPGLGTWDHNRLKKEIRRRGKLV